MTIDETFLEKVEANFRPDDPEFEARIEAIEKQNDLEEARRDYLAALLELETAARLLAAAGEYPELDEISIRGEIDYYSEKWNIPTGGENDD